MLILKGIGAGLVLLAATGIGFYFGAILNQRLEDLNKLRKKVFVLRGTIRYAGSSLPEALEEIGRGGDGVFEEFFQTTANMLQSADGGTFYDIWKKNTETILKKTAMNQKDRQELNKLGEYLGQLDKEMQLGQIDLYLDMLENDMEEARQSQKEKAHLYHMLGIMGGIFLVIIMI